MKSMVLCRLQWIEVAVTITLELLLASMKILYGETMWFEFNRNIIITG